MTLSFASDQDIADTASNDLTNVTPTGTNEPTYKVDNMAPTVTITGVPDTSTAAFPATFTFSEAVTGFVVGDVTVGNGTAGTFTVISDRIYTAQITPSAGGEVTVNVAADVAQDAAGNGNTAATEAKSVYTAPDTTAPRVTSIERQTPTTEATNADSLIWRVTFSEPVANVDADDFTVSGPTAATVTVSEVTATRVYAVTVSEGDLAGLTATVTLAFASDQDIADTASNDLTNVTPTGKNEPTYKVDNMAPTVTITGVPDTSTAAFTATFTFSEAVTGFVVGDVTVGNGTAGTFTVSSDRIYTAQITPSAGGEVTVNVAADVAQDAAGNGNTAATEAKSVYTAPDTTAPRVTSIERQTPTTEATNADSLIWRVTFSEPVANVDADDFTVSGPTAATVTVSEVTATRVYAVTVSEGDLAGLTATVTLSFASDQDIADTASNDLTNVTPTGTNEPTYKVDNIAPTVTITGVPDTSTAAFPATFTFSEAVTGFVVGDVTVGNGTAGTFTVISDRIYTAQITPAAGGEVTVNVAAAVAQDAAGNGNTAATEAKSVYTAPDTTAPRVTSIERQTPTTEATNADSLIWRVTFSEPVANVDAEDFTVSGPTAATVTVSEVTATRVYAVTVSEGDLAGLTATVTLSFASDQDIADTASNDLTNVTPTGKNEPTYKVDNIAPTVTITDVPEASTEAFTATFTFSEAVTGFVVGDVTVGNGTAGTFTASSVRVYTARITPASGGEVTVNVAAAVAQDAAGNGNTAATEAKSVYTAPDTAAPRVTSIERQTPTTEATNADSLIWRVTFSEHVANVDAEDFTVSGPTAATVTVSEVTATRVYDVTVSEGDLAGLTATVTLAFASDQDIADTASNDLTNVTPTGKNEPTYKVDNMAPTVTITGVPDTSTAAFPATFTFSEAVTGFVVGDVTVGNGTAGTFTASSDRIYTARITPASGGEVTVNVAADVAQDAAGNGNTAATEAKSVYTAPDTTAPRVTSIERQTPTTEATNADSLIWRVTFSEHVANVTAGDFTVSGPTAATVTVSEVTATRVYDVTVSEGDLAGLTATVTLSFASDQDIADTASNDLTNVTPTGKNEPTYKVDNMAPTVTITGVPDTSTAAFPATFTFSEAVTGFVVGDVTVGNGTAGTFTVISDRIYTAQITPAAGGEVTVNVAAAVAQDAAGNGNTAATEAKSVYTAPDTTAPRVTSIERQTPTTEATNADSLIWRVTFSEPVANVDADDFTVSGPTAATVTVSEVTATRVYAVTVSEGDLAGLTATVTLSFASDQDIADTASNDLTNVTPTGKNEPTYKVDNIAPTVTITGVPDTSTAAFPATFTFSEAVTGFVVGDVTVGNGTAGTFTVISDRIYTAQITPAAGGEVTVNVAADVAQDAAGSGNTAATEAKSVYTAPDTAAPRVTSIERQTPTTEATNADSLIWRVTFSEHVANVDAEDFTVSGPTGATVTVSEVTATTVYDVTVSEGDLAGLTATVTLSFAGDQDIADTASNDLTNVTPTGKNEPTYKVDNMAPTVTITDVPEASTAAFTATFTFSEAVTGFVVGDVTVGNGTAGTFTVISDRIYTARITPASGGEVTVNVAADVAQDAAGNGNTAATEAKSVYTAPDTTAPRVTSIERQTPTTEATNADSLIWRVTFSEPVKNVTAEDFTVSGPTAATVTVSEVTATTVYDVTVSEGDLAGLTATVTLSFASDQDIADTASNDLTNVTPTGKNEPTYKVDNIAPTVTITDVPEASTEAFTATFTFSEAVTGFVVGDVTVGNGTAGTFTVISDRIYTARITPASGGEVTVNVAADVAQDAAGNGNTAATEAKSVYTAPDTAAPRVTSIERQTPTTEATNADSLIWRVTFSEHVANVDAEDFTVSGPTGATVTVSEVTATTVYDVTVSEGDLAGLTATVTLSFAGDQDIADTASNDLTNVTPTGKNEPTYKVDNIAPTVTITDVPEASTEAFTATFTFSEAVTGFVVGDVTVGNGTAGTFTVISDRIYTARITPASGGEVTVNVAADVAQDAAGNGNTAATEAKSVYTAPDTTAPRVTSIERQTPTTEATNADSLIWRVTFNKAVANVTAGDFTVSGPTAATVTVREVTATTVYDVTVSGGNLASLTATVTLSFAGDQDIEDADGNALTNLTPTGTNEPTYEVDNTAPTVTITGVPATSTEAFTATFTFSEAVTGFVVGDVTVGNGTAGTFTASSDRIYTARITPSSGGEVTVNVAADVAQDAAGNGNTAATEAKSVYTAPDDTAPTVVSVERQDPGTEATNANRLTWRVTFNKAVANVTAGDFTVSGPTAATVTVSEVTATTVYDVTVSGGNLASLTATVTLSFAGDQDIEDADGNALTNLTPTGTNEPTYEVDNTAPTVTITGVPATSTEAFTATFTFSEAVTGFVVGDVTVGNGTASAFTASSVRVYTARITPAAGGDVTVNVAAAVAQDAAGNGNTAATEARSTYTAPDATAPRVASIERQTPTTEATNADRLTWRVTFNKAVENVTADDFAVSGTTASVTGVAAVAGMDHAWDVTVGGGNLAGLTATVTLAFASGHDIKDGADNALTATTPTGTNEASYAVDNTAPVVTEARITSAPGGADGAWRTGDTLKAVVLFSRAVTVDTTGGMPTLAVMLGDRRREAVYYDGSESPANDSVTVAVRLARSRPPTVTSYTLTRALRFHYEVGAADDGTHGAWVVADGLSANGATIRSAAGVNATGAGLPDAVATGPVSDPPAILPPAISIADATVEEGPGAVLEFAVTLDRESQAVATVDWETRDGSARAGEDYVGGSGTLVFAPGETARTIRVTVLDDAHDEDREVMLVVLSNPVGATIATVAAGGSIDSSDLMPQAWLSRFGRTVAEQVLDAVETRIRSAPPAGVRMTVAGQAIGAAGAPDAEALEEAEARAHRAGARSVTPRELLAGSSFALTTQADGIGGGLVSLWGRGAVSRFDGREDEFSLSGEVTGALLGADWTRERSTLGFMLSHVRGEGGYRGADSGEVTSTLTGFYPYGRYLLGDRVTVWGAAGYGAGTLTLTPENDDGTPRAAIRTDMDLMMAAVGLRGVLVKAPDDGGPELAVKTDALGVRTASEAVRGSGDTGGNLAPAQGDVTRLRLGLEGTWRGLAVGRGTLEPRLEVGVRHEDGDAETGYGLDLGGGLAWSDPATGIEAGVSGRGLLTHDAGGFRELGIAGSFGWDPAPGSDRGPSLSLTQTMGLSATGGADALLGRRTLEGLAANDDGDELDRRRLELRLGYGFAAFGDRFTSRPEVGLGMSEGQRDYGLVWRLVRHRRRGDIGSLEFALEARRRESVNDNAEPEYDIGFRMTARW